MKLDKFYQDQPPLPWQRNLEQKNYNSACTRDISEILRLTRGISMSSYRMMSIKFYNGRP